MNDLAARFLRYARVGTASDPGSGSSPSTRCQLDFLRSLAPELLEAGATEVELDETGTLYATVPGGSGTETVALLAHVDTSPEAPGEGVEPRMHEGWDGRPIDLGEGQVIDPDETEDMLRYRGGTIITSGGDTLLGADDKAGVAVIVEACRLLAGDPGLARPRLRIALTTDEEIGRGVDGLDVERLGADFAYTVDGGPLGRIDTMTFNAWSLLWRVRGREVHPGHAHGIMVSALRVLGSIVSMLPAEEMPENTRGMEGYDFPMSLRATVAEGELKHMLRDFTEEGMRSRLARAEALREAVRALYPGAEVELEAKEQYRNPHSVINRDRRLVDCAIEGSRRAGFDPVETSIRGGTDGSRLSFMGVPTVNLPTGGEMFHSRREWIAVEGLQGSLDTLMATLAAWDGEGSGDPLPTGSE